MTRVCLLGTWLFFSVGLPVAEAQERASVVVRSASSSTTDSYDARLVRSIYAIDTPGFVNAMEGAHLASVPMLIGLPLVVWGGTLWTDAQPALALSAAWVGTFGTVTLLKNTIRRPRPFFVLVGIERRGAGPTDVIDRYSFPSGHAGLSFTIATSLSLSYPEWYVVAPAYLWASATALSRVWHGVHYPSDILVGALLGSGIAIGAHLFVDALLARRNDDPASQRLPPMIGFSLPLR
ncbi:MAG: phosphatase PAP2 family protein [Bacteroidota bacterium]